jgi:hypothetical protein
MYLDNDEHSRRTAASHAAVLVGYFGADYDVRRLTVNDTTRYATARRAGGIPIHRRERDREGDGTRSVSGRCTPGLSLLRTLLIWACTVRTANGDRWLERNPLEGVRFEREKNPKRSTATWDQYEATRKGAREAGRRGGNGGRATQVDAAAVRAVAGRGARPSARLDRRAHWEDFDLGGARWCGAPSRTRKARSGSRRSRRARQRVELFRQALGGVAGPVFPRAATRPGRSRPRCSASGSSKPRPLAGREARRSLWHAYRGSGRRSGCTTRSRPSRRRAAGPTSGRSSRATSSRTRRRSWRC